MTIDPGAVIEQAVESLSSADPRTFRSVSLPPSFNPCDVFDSAGASDVVASYERPSLGFALVGVGEADRADLPFGLDTESARADVARLLGGAGEVGSLRPRLLGGFAFDGSRPLAPPWTEYEPGALVLPRLLFVREQGESGVILAPGVDALELARCLAPRDPVAAGSGTLRAAREIDRRAWLEGVRVIASQVRDGAYEKAVLATTRELVAAAPFDAGRVLARLRSMYPECHVFSMRSGASTFLGASPELLASLRDGVATALGLAGSAQRGATDEDDERLGNELLGSAKNRREHETVVRAIRSALEGLTEQLCVPEAPQLRRLRNIQHLATEIAGRVLPGVDVLELVRRLHPTPAVCGWPREAARKVIAALEGFERGWYAGPIGWLDARGEGEFAVALRSALVRHEHAWLFAGNGIMGDSDPEAELAEVQLKFRPLTEALAAS